MTGIALALDDVERIALDHVRVDLGDEARGRVAAARAVVDATAGTNMSTYGLNTGVGRFVDTRIPDGLTGELQRRVLRSHAAGVGEPYPDEVVRAAHLLRINTLALGYSGVRVELVERMLDILNAGIIPYVPGRGSVGASGDLAPLSHLCLPVIGEGRAYVDGELMSSADALARRDIAPLELASKEGLSLINGTQFMTAMGTIYGLRAQRLLKVADVACALSVEALKGSQDSFLPQIHALRPHPGQIAAAANMYRAMDSSSILDSHRFCDRVQDAYALRCAPQVHGASRDAINHAMVTMQIEATSVTDNPLVFADEGLLRSNGNFHGQPIAISLDVMAIALSEIANISERRVERLVNPTLSGLPAFLTANGGLNSGYMIAQYTAASLVSENKVLSHPASVDSIPTSANQEDHVSMGNACRAEARAGVVERRARRGDRAALRHAGRSSSCARVAQAPVPARWPSWCAATCRILEDDRILGDEIELIAQKITTREFLADLEAGMGFTLQ